MTIQIKSGGKLDRLTERLGGINVYSDNNEQINLWLIDTRGNESLTYLSIQEAIDLKNSLIKAIHDTV